MCTFLRRGSSLFPIFSSFDLKQCCVMSACQWCRPVELMSTCLRPVPASDQCLCVKLRKAVHHLWFHTVGSVVDVNDRNPLESVPFFWQGVDWPPPPPRPPSSRWLLYSCFIQGTHLVTGHCTYEWCTTQAAGQSRAKRQPCGVVHPLPHRTKLAFRVCCAFRKDRTSPHRLVVRG